MGDFDCYSKKVPIFALAYVFIEHHVSKQE